VVYDNLVTAIGSQRGLNGLGNGTAGVDVANNSAIFSVVAVVGWLAVRTKRSWVESVILLVAVLEEARIRGVGYRERHGCGV
jgi:hypothetical protein